mmetsp:Transcript_52056/g.123284  ORF Transcript_52056/g.123284 Transcript_52056/m.123284 type:complete len:208 (+) Transcript_52056:164-787(+)
MPEKPSIARRPFLSSTSWRRANLDWSLARSRGSKPKSPGWRSLPWSICTMATKPKSSRKPSQTRSCCMAPCDTAALWSAVTLASPNVATVPGNWYTSCTSRPVAASMHTRPCLSSASRSHLMSYLVVKPRGSKPTSPTIFPSSAAGRGRKGTESEFCIFMPEMDLVARAVDMGRDGANAEAPAARARQRTERIILDENLTAFRSKIT